MKASFLFIGLFILFFTSCSVTKRQYRNGFFIQHHVDIGIKNKDVKTIPNDYVHVETINQTIAKKFIENPTEEQNQEILFNESGSKIKTNFSNKTDDIETKEFVKFQVEKNNIQPTEKKIRLLEDKYEDNSVLALALANKAFKHSIWALIFCWIFFIGFIEASLAIKKGKRALFLNDSNDVEIEKKAKNAILISEILLLLYSIGILILISVLFILFF